MPFGRYRRFLSICLTDKKRHFGIGLPAANMLERLGCNRIAQMSGNAEMRCPLPRFDPRCHQIDRIGGSMRRKCGEIIGLRQTFEISAGRKDDRSEEHTSELQSLMRSSYRVFCLTKKKDNQS